MTATQKKAAEFCWDCSPRGRQLSRSDTPVTCLECGGKMTSQRETVKYDTLGLRNVTLVNVEVRRCQSCGEHEVVIPRINQLLWALRHRR